MIYQSFIYPYFNVVISNVIKYYSIFYQVDELQFIKPFPVARYINCLVI